MNAQRFAEARVLHGVRSVTLEIFDKHHRKNACEKCHARDIDPMDTKPTWLKHRHDVERHVAEMHQPAPYTERDHHWQRKLRVDSQQRKEGKGKMTKDQHHSNIPPRTAFTIHVPERFFG